MKPNSDGKQSAWNQLVDEFRRKTDKMGSPIDKGILETIVALNALSIPTSASCEGHLNWGIAAPWVDVEPEKTEDAIRLKEEMRQKWDEAKAKEKEGGPKTEVEQTLKKYHELEVKVKRPILLLTQKTLLLLDEFYKGRPTSVDLRLIVRGIGLDTIRLESQGSIIQEIREVDDRKNRLEEYQKEMAAFTAFLKTRFLELNP